MSKAERIVGTVVSDNESPTFEIVRIKLKADIDVKPGEIVRVALDTSGEKFLIGRIRSAYERNPNEQADAVAVRDTLAIQANYPREQDSTIIFRQIEADLIEEMSGGDICAPQTLPRSGAAVHVADDRTIMQAIGLANDKAQGLHIGDRIGTANFEVLLKREAIQRHFFICGTTGSGKSYAMGVLAEELVRHGLPVVFLDTQDEYSDLVESLGGKVVRPGEDFTLRISSLTELEVIDLVPTDSELHKNMIGVAYNELQDELRASVRTKFLVSDLVQKIRDVGPQITRTQSSVDLAALRTKTLERIKIFGTGIDRANWPALMRPCLALSCKHLTARRLQTVATAVLRELQELRLQEFIPPYVAVIDEAHLFVPEGQDSPCKQIIREGVRIGRHHGICMVLLTQSPVDIDKRAIRQCNTRLVFALEPDQLDAIRGVKADATEEMLRALSKMPRGTCLLSGTYESVKHATNVHIRGRRTPEGGKAPDIFLEMSTNWPPPHAR